MNQFFIGYQRFFSSSEPKTLNSFSHCMIITLPRCQISFELSFVAVGDSFRRWQQGEWYHTLQLRQRLFLNLFQFSQTRLFIVIRKLYKRVCYIDGVVFYFWRDSFKQATVFIGQNAVDQKQFVKVSRSVAPHIRAIHAPGLKTSRAVVKAIAKQF